MKKLHEVNNKELRKKDVEIATFYKELIQQSRSPEFPQPGDALEFTDKFGNFYPKAHLEKINEDGTLYICENPMAPFVEGHRMCFSTSGGAWRSLPPSWELIGSYEKIFFTWDSSGPRAGGGLYFPVMVKKWKYKEPSLFLGYSAENYFKYEASFLRKPTDMGYIILVRKNAVSHKGFKTNTEYLQWLLEIDGIQFDYTPESKVIFAPKEG